MLKVKQNWGGRQGSKALKKRGEHEQTLAEYKVVLNGHQNLKTHPTNYMYQVNFKTGFERRGMHARMHTRLEQR